MPFVNTYIHIYYLHGMGTYLKRPSWCDVLCKCHCTFSVLIVIADQMNIHIPTKRVQTETNYSPGADVPSIIFGVLDKQSGWMENDKGKNAKEGELFSSSSFRKKTLKSCWIWLVLIKRCIYCNMTQCFKIRKNTYSDHFIKSCPLIS